MKMEDETNTMWLIEELEKETICEICFQKMDVPKSLPCTHTFCLCCMKLQIQGNWILSCPLCRAQTTVKNGDPKSLPTAFLVNRISDILDRHEKRCAMMHDSLETLAKEQEAEIETGNESLGKASCPAVKNQEISVKPKFRPETPRKLVSKSRIQVHGSKQDALLRQYQRRISLPTSPSEQETEAWKTTDKGRRKTFPALNDQPAVPSIISPIASSIREAKGIAYDVILEKTLECTNEKHVYHVESSKCDYVIEENVELTVWKYCEGKQPCGALSDDIQAVLSDVTGRVLHFSHERLWNKDKNGWLLSCKVSYDGQFSAVVKVGGKPIYTTKVNVYSYFTEPIHV